MSEIQNNELNNRSCQFRAQENSITDENDKNGNEAERMKIIQRDIEKGVITVSNVNEKDDLDVEISKLDKIPRFEPLIKPHAETGFTLSGLWGSAPASSDHVKEPSFGYDSLFNFALTYQSLIKKCVEEICEDQRIVMETVKSVDTYCVEINQTMIAAQLQAKTNYEQMGIVNVFMKQVEKTHKMVHEIFQTLNKIENLLPAEERLTDQSASIKHPTLHKLWLNTRQKHNHGSFQFETRRLSLQKRRTHFSVVTVSFDTVLSDKHQDSDIALSPVRSPDGTILSNVQSVLGSSEDSSASDRLKEIFSNQSQSSEDISSSQWLSAMRESVKKANTSIENLQGLQEVHAATNNYGSPNSSPSLLSSNSSQYHKSPINNVNKPSSPGSSISLLTAMLRRTTVKEGETKNKVTPKIRKKKSISSSIHNHNSTVSKTSIEEITISNDHGRKNDLKDLTHPKQVSKEGLIIQFESEDSRSSSEERNDNMEDSEI
ncbi:579_t:CDS:2 [Funneliformis geosporum]|uniref:BLOC-1-related complex subunit 5 n=1 Tax=Funneliformis geosporum TaxID=1117311 RepID=A0A9W4STU4_9GLOM|nr:579_t:CDS:2 [Funneliformis geosporum]